MTQGTFTLYLLDRGYLLVPSATIPNEMVKELQEQINRWDGPTSLLVSKYPITVVDRRSRR